MIVTSWIIPPTFNIYLFNQSHLLGGPPKFCTFHYCCSDLRKDQKVQVVLKQITLWFWFQWYTADIPAHTAGFRCMIKVLFLWSTEIQLLFNVTILWFLSDITTEKKTKRKKINRQELQITYYNPPPQKNWFISRVNKAQYILYINITWF